MSSTHTDVTKRTNSPSAGWLIAAMLVVVLGGCSKESGQVPTSKVEGELTRAEFVALVSDYFGWYHASGYNDYWKVPLRTFADVKASDPFGKAIENAYEENIIAPDASGNFNPHAGMRRADAAEIFVSAFHLELLADTSVLASVVDSASIAEPEKSSVATIVAAGFMAPRAGGSFAPDAVITIAEAQAVIEAIAADAVVAVQAMPKQAARHLTMLPDSAGSAGESGVVDDSLVQALLKDRNYAPRRFIHLSTPTPGATIYYTTDGSDPRTSSTRQVYHEAATGHIQELVGERSGAKGPQPYRLVTWNTVAVKNGLAISPVRTFKWNLVRPWESVYGADVVEEGNFDPAKGPILPKVTRMYSDAESVRSMSWLIEGPESAIVFDALQTPWNSADQVAGTLYDKVRTLTDKPLKLVIGHAHGDHASQAQNFLNAGVPVYANHRSWNSHAALLASVDNIKQIINVDEGDSFELGTASIPLRFDVYAPPGHENSLVNLHHRESGYLFSTDFYGCTRMGTADNVGITGARQDLVLSILMQNHHQLTRDGGKLTKVFTGHDESPLPGEHLMRFQQLLQGVIDKQEAANSPTLRSSDQPRNRTTTMGNMFTDGTDWLAIGIGGIFGTTPYNYLSAPTPLYSSHPTIDFTQPNAHLKYAVLGNIELSGATLVGTNLTWAAPNMQVTLSDDSKWPVEGPVPNTLADKFNPFVFSYQINVAAGTNMIDVRPIPLSSKVKSIVINGENILPGSSVAMAVTNGAVVTIVVTAPDGMTTETYELTIVTQ